MIVGAGDAGALLLRELNQYHIGKRQVIGFIDDDKTKIGKYMVGTKVLGSRDDIAVLADNYEIDEIIANSLRIFGQGLKVCVEISMMAADAGFVSTTKPVVVFGGTGTGIDCVVILKPENTHNFFDIKINEIICKPKLF